MLRNLLKAIEDKFSAPTLVGAFLVILYDCFKRVIFSRRGPDPEKQYAIANTMNFPSYITRSVKTLDLVLKTFKQCCLNVH
jgi:hypothetical protein